MSNAKIRYRRRKRVQQAQAWARESQRWAPKPPWLWRALLKHVSFGLPGGMRQSGSTVETALVLRNLWAGL
jgi:hypothetical protein